MKSNTDFNSGASISQCKKDKDGKCCGDCKKVQKMRAAFGLLEKPINGE